MQQVDSRNVSLDNIALARLNLSLGSAEQNERPH